MALHQKVDRTGRGEFDPTPSRFLRCGSVHDLEGSRGNLQLVEASLDLATIPDEDRLGDPLSRGVDRSLGGFAILGCDNRGPPDASGPRSPLHEFLEPRVALQGRSGEICGHVSTSVLVLVIASG